MPKTRLQIQTEKQSTKHGCIESSCEYHCQELFYSQSEVEEIKQEYIKKINQLTSDFNDMYNAHNTIFLRCGCGHLKERGLICPNKNCIGD